MLGVGRASQRVGGRVRKEANLRSPRFSDYAMAQYNVPVAHMLHHLHPSLSLDGALTLLGGVGTLGKLVMHFPKLTLVEVCHDPRTG